MFEYDICICADADKCPLRETCKRAIMQKKVGIYTASNFFQFYKEGYGCEYYWEKKNEE